MSALDPERAESAADVSALSVALYGEALGAMRGVLHVVAVVEEDGAHRVLKIGEHAPKSAWDRFVLGLARARAEAILVTGAVLRAEPDLVYELPARGLYAYREKIAGLPEPPILLVLTGGDVALEHPALCGWARPVLFTTRAAAARLAGAGVEVASAEAPSARAAIAYLRSERGCRSVSVEAGPRAAGPLYDPPPVIDELMRSVYEGPLDPRARGAFLPEPSHLVTRSRARPDAQHPWRFERWTR
ncbi:MAG: hypothetical protein M5U28_50530 [Sandaracinaceae bacterium]|nr:hypothetical protein [Sandaracinaceae bacterium]